MGTMLRLPSREVLALAALQAASRALSDAESASRLAGYGSQVLGPLCDARRELEHAFATAEGRT